MVEGFSEIGLGESEASRSGIRQRRGGGLSEKDVEWRRPRRLADVCADAAGGALFRPDRGADEWRDEGAGGGGAVDTRRR